MMKEKIKIFSNQKELARNFGDYFYELSSKNKKTNVALSGGSTPRILFDYLAVNCSDSTFWENIHLYWGDERCVPPVADDSNYKMTKEHLLDKIEIPVKNVHRILGENNPAVEAKRYSDLLLKNLSVKNNLPVFDLVILGIGNDGHAASIFPHQMELLDSENICDVAEHPVSGQKRISLTGKVINNAKEIVFLVTGENKKQKTFEIIHKTGNWKTYPAYHIKPLSGKISWFLDAAAASLL